jgi:uncharacterized protein Yka (UPF0111/DUF47 family)
MHGAKRWAICADNLRESAPMSRLEEISKMAAEAQDENHKMQQACEQVVVQLEKLSSKIDDKHQQTREQMEALRERVMELEQKLDSLTAPVQQAELPTQPR